MGKIRYVLRTISNIYWELYRSWIRNLDGRLGQKLRHHYYGKRMKSLGRLSIIDTGVYIGGAEYISIGENTHIDKGCFIVAADEHLDLSERYMKYVPNRDFKLKRGEIHIGDNCHIGRNSSISGYGGVSIGNNCTFSEGVKCYSLSNLAYNPLDRSEVVSIMPYTGKSPSIEGPVVLEDNTWAGIDAILLPGVTIGRNSFVKAQTLVKDSFPENSYIGGNPAVRIRERYAVNQNDGY